MKLRLVAWPYPTGMPVHLYWVSSPTQIGRVKQWQQKTLFLGQNGTFHEYMLPWGLIPMLKLGSLCVDGEVTEKTPAGVVNQFRLGDIATCRVTLSDYIRNEWLDRIRGHQKSMLLENCVCIEDGETRLWIPCIEIARAFFAINKQLAYLLLDPMGLSKICSSELTGDKVQAHFNKEIPVAALNRLLAMRVAMICHHSPWDIAWRKVWNCSIRHLGEPTVSSRLYSCPPILNNSTWSVRGIPCSNGFFVLEIKGVRTAAKLPFSEVTYTHPDLKYSPEDGEATAPGNGAGNGTVCNGERSEEGEIDTSTLPPKKARSPRCAPLLASSIQFGNDVNVLKGYGVGKPAPRRSNTSGGAGKGKNGAQAKGPVPVSMNDEAGVGIIQAAEFKPIENVVGVTPGLESFIAAIKGVKNVQAACAIGAVPDDSPLAKIHDGQRHFALAYVRIFGKLPGEGYILEIDSSDGHRVSTLVFQPEDGFGGLDTANMILKECISKAGYWNADFLSGRNAIRNHKLVRHRLLQPLYWGGRLCVKVSALTHIRRQSA